MVKESLSIYKRLTRHCDKFDKTLKALTVGIAAMIAGCTTGELMTKAQMQELDARSDVVGYLWKKTDDPDLFRVACIKYRTALEQVELLLEDTRQLVIEGRRQMLEAWENSRIYHTEMSIDAGDNLDNARAILGKLEKENPGTVKKFLNQIINLRGEWEQIDAERHVFNAIRFMQRKLAEKDDLEGVVLPLEPDVIKKWDAEMMKGAKLRDFKTQLSIYNRLKQWVLE